MSTLSDATYATRQFLKYFFICIVVIIVGVLIFQAYNFIKLTFFTKPPPPIQGFGILPRLEFKASEISSYRINTVSGTLPAFPDRAFVVGIKKPETNLLLLDTARKKLRDLHFSNNEQKIDDVQYEWTDSQNPSKIISFNILTNDFDIKSNYLQVPETYSLYSIPSDENARKAAVEFLSHIIADSDSLSTTEGPIQYLRVADENLVPIEDAKEAQVIKVTLQYKPLLEKQIFFSNLKDSEMTFFITGGEKEPQIQSAHFNYRSIDQELFSTYPLKTSQEAYADLTSGKSKNFILSSDMSTDILNMYLAYFMSDGKPNFVQPIYVFEGKNFYAFVDALAESATTTSAYLK